MGRVQLRLSILIARSAGWLSRTFARKSGETLPGRILLSLCPNALTLLSSGRTVLLVSGTNGKTSTTKALAAMAASRGTVVTSGTGSNLSWGAASALMKHGEYAVLEVDELHLPNVAAQTNPAVVLLLNLTRDQLHRMHEVKKVASRWREMAEKSSAHFVGDIDDPFVNYALGGAQSSTRVSFGGRHHPDGSACPSCGQYLDWNGGIYSCPCGLNNTSAHLQLEGETAGARNYRLAQVAAEIVGVRAKGLEVDADMERTADIARSGRHAHLRLTKNPASWTEALRGVHGDNVILILNARQVDGIDTSWLWDVTFAALKGKKVLVTGERALDMAYRLHVEGVESELADNFDKAMESFDTGAQVEVLAAYTAFHGLVMR